MSIEPIMLSNHLILCHSLLLLPSIFPSIRVFSNESVLLIRWPKYWGFSFSILILFEPNLRILTRNKSSNGRHPLDHRKKKESSRKTSTSALLTMSKPLTVDHNKLWKIPQEMGIPDHLTCLLRNLYAGQETTVRIGHGTTDWLHIRKGVHKGCVLSPCLCNLHAEYIM